MSHRLANLVYAMAAVAARREAMLSTLLEQFGRRPRTPREAYRDFVNSWGECNYRTFWRALRRLRESGALQRIASRHTSEITYRRAA